MTKRCEARGKVKEVVALINYVPPLLDRNVFSPP
jgi:hypothetical protein